MRNSKEKEASQAARKDTTENKINQIDRISELPDPILVSIISLLPLQEAVTTSILSTRWRHLYTDITRLDFQPVTRTIVLKPPEQFHGSKPRKLDSTGVIKTPLELQEEIPIRSFWISQFLDSYTNAASQVLLKEIRLNIVMPFAERVDIDKWLEFALSTQVEIFSMHLNKYANSDTFSRRVEISSIYSNEYMDSRYFPVENLVVKISNCRTCFTTLKTLDLCNVDLQVTELFLSKCDVLERLSIERCRMQGNLVITGPKLKYLYICACVASVKVRDAVNLVSFTYEWQKDLMVVENVPMLTQIDTDASRIHTHVELLRTLSRCIPQLMKLNLRIKPYELERYEFPQALPKLINLKHLVLRLDMSYGLCILPLALLIKASPSLQKLEMKFFWYTSKLRDGPEVDKYIWEHTHYNLKKVKFSGCLGSSEELEFASYIFMNAVKLEEFEVELEPYGRICAPVTEQQFQAITPKSVKLVIH